MTHSGSEANILGTSSEGSGSQEDGSERASMSKRPSGLAASRMVKRRNCETEE